MKKVIGICTLTVIALISGGQLVAQTLNNGTKPGMPVPYKDFFTVDTTVVPHEMHIKVNPDQNLFTDEQSRQLREKYPDYVLKFDTVREVNHFETKQHFMHVNSNTTTGSFQLQYTLPLNISGTVRVSNNNGKFICSYYLTPNKKVKEIDMHDLASGKYIFDLFFNNTQQDQLIISLMESE